MSEQTIGLSRSVDARATLPWLVAAAVYLLLMALGGRLIADPDIYSHIALGRLILDQHALPATDPFSARIPGGPSVDYDGSRRLATPSLIGSVAGLRLRH